MSLPLDFDDNLAWSPSLGRALEAVLSPSGKQKLANAKVEYVEDACRLLFDLAGRDAVIDVALRWLRDNTIIAYHGTRLTDAEVESVQNLGLVPLVAENHIRVWHALYRCTPDGAKCNKN